MRVNRMFSHLAGQLSESQTLISNLRKGRDKAVRIGQRIVLCCAVVEPECLLVYVAVKVKRFDSNIGAAQGALEQRPEILDAVRVYQSTDVLFRVIHYVMHEAVMQIVITNMLVGIDLRAVFHFAEDFILQSLAFHIRNYLSADLPKITVEQTHDDGFAVPSAAFLVADFLILVHVLELAAHKRLVHFNRAAVSTELEQGIILQGQAQAMQYEPRRLLVNSQSLCEFIAGDTVLAIAEHPQRRKPLLQGDGGILENRVQLHAELASAIAALPALLCLDVIRVLCAAVWTLRAIRPTQRRKGVNADLFVAKVLNRLL